MTRARTGARKGGQKKTETDKLVSETIHGSEFERAQWQQMFVVPTLQTQAMRPTQVLFTPALRVLGRGTDNTQIQIPVTKSLRVVSSKFLT